MTRPSPYTRSDFRLFRPLQTRWSDNDIYGHMNNVVHYLLFDTAVNGWLIDRGLLDIRNGDTIGLVVETGCQYFREIMFPDSVTAGILVTRLGNSSVTYEVGLFANEDDGAAAQGRFVHVYVDRETRRPKALPDDWRTALQEISA
ncbi:acyl-CoA thioesterase [Hoeflea sp. WL0058]|uniref:Acyl-CoA thioesterase n=1 Tax=Flavimaribacter sediminis TaxID=2865987 RepID=A0AAE3D055_9HYPH|nr:thioesterase family protein [Flavimaribacter sediminis]MBW8638105.1 acyl-CoA thioesterase [Flavimaribacter sediminis]